MLFSRTDVSAAIERDFEPAWVSVRAVPTVTIDFGGGRVVKRTLHGNVATLVVSPRGELVDAIPGVSTPRVYLEQLSSALGLARSLTGEPLEDRARFLAHHRGRLGRAEEPQIRMPDMGKMKVEMPTKAVLFPAAIDPRVEPGDVPPADLSTWSALQSDTQHNINERRAQIHAKLADVGLVRPATLVKWLYREVLHVDLDDPYLGLGKLLFDGPSTGHPVPGGVRERAPVFRKSPAR